ncbi:MAG: hypothetical protein DRH17_11095 [Deltaproteobacteria bacterium]|nr:MAG: hypothetical protein DRH17_11095 [Deltaproteobacteria bacterium]
MTLRIKPLLKKKIQTLIASRPDLSGIKMLLRLNDKLFSFTLGTIKICEKKRGGIHPKHWVTDFHEFFLENIKTTDSVLEVGCAYGHVASEIAKKAKYVQAIDNRPEAIAEAKKLFSRENLRFECNDFWDWPEENAFDIIILSNVLEHIENRVEFLMKASRIGKKLLIRVPSYKRDWLVPYKEKLGLEWRLSTDHQLEYTEGILREELSQAGLKAVEIFSEWGNYCCIAVQR